MIRAFDRRKSRQNRRRSRQVIMEFRQTEFLSFAFFEAEFLSFAEHPVHKCHVGQSPMNFPPL